MSVYMYISLPSAHPPPCMGGGPEASWTFVGISWNACRGLLGTVLKTLGSRVGDSWGLFWVSWGLLGPLGGLLGPLGGLLGAEGVCDAARIRHECQR